MKLLLLLVMLTACAASPKDLSGKMFTFPEVTASANVRLTTSMQSFSAATVCFRFITDLSRGHSLFSLSTPQTDNALLLYKEADAGVVSFLINDGKILFGGLDYKLNMWHSICFTWDAGSGLAQLWFDGKPSVRKLIGGSEMTNPIVILGQEQDSHGGGFDISQSFVGMMSDVHMWNYTLSSCEIQYYVDNLNFSPGNMLNWRSLTFQPTGRVLTENNENCN